jgi:hypothetical protein
MSSITLVPPPADRDATDDQARPVLHISRWPDPVADHHGVHPCSRYVELYWLGIIGPSTTWLLRRISYGLEMHEDGFDLHLAECARSLGLGDRLGKNSPFWRALQRLCTFDLARPSGPGGLAVRTAIPPLPLRHVQRLPLPLQRSHQRWFDERRLSQPEQVRRRAERLASELAAAGKGREEIERRLGDWQFHPAVAFRAAQAATERGVVTASVTRSSRPNGNPSATAEGGARQLSPARPRARPG